MTIAHEISLLDQIGEHTILFPSVEIVIQNKPDDGRGITVGSHCVIYPRNRLVLGDMSVNTQANLIIGDHVLINAGGYLSGEGGLIIHDYVLIGPNVCLLSAGHQYHDPDRLIQHQGLTYGRIVIHRDAWIGGGAVVLEGIEIGQGAVVGAGSVVCHNVPPYAVVVGNPARVITYRKSRSSSSQTRLSLLFHKLKSVFSRHKLSLNTK